MRCDTHVRDVLGHIAALLETDQASLLKALTFRIVAARGEIYETKLVRQQLTHPVHQSPMHRYYVISSPYLIGDALMNRQHLSLLKLIHSHAIEHNTRTSRADVCRRTRRRRMRATPSPKPCTTGSSAGWCSTSTPRSIPHCRRDTAPPCSACLTSTDSRSSSRTGWLLGVGWRSFVRGDANCWIFPVVIDALFYSCLRHS